MGSDCSRHPLSIATALRLLCPSWSPPRQSSFLSATSLLQERLLLLAAPLPPSLCVLGKEIFPSFLKMGWGQGVQLPEWQPPPVPQGSTRQWPRMPVCLSQDTHAAVDEFCWCGPPLLWHFILSLYNLHSTHPGCFPAHAGSIFYACCFAEHFEPAQWKHIYADAGCFCQSRNSPIPSHRPPAALLVLEIVQVPLLCPASKHTLLFLSLSCFPSPTHLRK